MLRENAIYTIYLYLCPPFPLSKYIQWRAVKRGGGGGGAEEVRGVWKDLPLPSTFQHRIRFMRNIVTQQAIVVNTCESDRF